MCIISYFSHLAFNIRTVRIICLVICTLTFTSFSRCIYVMQFFVFLSSLMGADCTDGACSLPWSFFSHDS